MGGTARYGVAQLIHVSSSGFPWATFWTNISGSFAIGLIAGVLAARFPTSRYIRPFAVTGFLGAYTTFSTFAVEVDLLAKDGHTGVAVLYAATSVVVGVLAAVAGLALAHAAT